MLDESFCLMCLTEHELSFQWYGPKETVESVHENVTLRCKLRQSRDSWIFALTLTRLHEKQVVSQLPFARPFSSCVSVLCYLFGCVVCLMPPRNQFILEQTKAFLTEQQRIRTERRLAQLRQDQRQLELSEVLNLLAFLWVIGIVLFYARLYLGPQE